MGSGNTSEGGVGKLGCSLGGAGAQGGAWHGGGMHGSNGGPCSTAWSTHRPSAEHLACSEVARWETNWARSGLNQTLGPK